MADVTPKNVVKVAVVEDNQHTRESLRLLLDSTPGLSCVAACASGEQALQEIPSRAPDVVLMDIQLPGMSGIECIQQLKRLAPKAQLLMLTVLEDHDRIFKSLSAGAIGYIIKGTPPAKLLDAILDAHRGGAPMSSQIARQVVQSFQSSTSELPAARKLSPREHEILDLLAHGFLYKEIAEKLGIAIGTVRVHIRKIYDKLHARNRTEAVNKGLRR